MNKLTPKDLNRIAREWTCGDVRQLIAHITLLECEIADLRAKLAKLKEMK